MLGFFIFIHVVISILLVLVVLMQSSKGGGLAGAFGGTGAAGAIFGGRGAGTLLTKTTTVLAVLFMLSSLAQVFISKGSTGTRSVVQKELSQPVGTSPAASLPGLPGETTLPQGTASPDTTRN